MKIFFSTTPHAKRLYTKEIQKIYDALRSLDAELVDDTIEKITEEEFYQWDAKKRKDYYEKTIRNIKTADVTIFETTYPSLGVGHLINQALNFGKPAIALFTQGKRPFMLDSANNEKIILIEYTLDDVKEQLEHAFEYAKDRMDVRFNFFISPDLSSYLDWLTKHRNIPRSVFLRNLIEREMKKDVEYQTLL